MTDKFLAELRERMMKSAGMTTNDVYQTMYSDEDREKVK